MSEKDEAYTLILYEFLKQNQAVWSRGMARVEVTVDQGHIDLAEKLSEEFPDYGSLKRGDDYIGYYDLEAGDRVTFELVPKRNSHIFHAQNLDDLLGLKSVLIDRPKNIVVQELDYVSFKSTDEPLAISAYYGLNAFLRQTIDLEVLEGRVDEDLLLFFTSGTLKVKAKTDGGTLDQNADGIISAVDAVLPILTEEKYRDDKVRLLKAVLYDSWRNVRADERMSHFLRHCEEIAKNFSNNYELFVSEFSFDSETEKLVKEQHEFSGRLSAILTSIQGRILAVPLSLILAFGQMKTKPEDNPLLINTGILVAAAVFAVLMWILLNSQDQVLLGLKQEIDSKVNRFKLNIPDLYLQVEDLFTSLDKQYRSTRRMLRLLKVLIVLGLIITLLAWVYLTPEVREGIESFVVNLET